MFEAGLNLKAHRSPSSLDTVNMALRSSVIIRVCMGIKGPYRIVQNKGIKNNKMGLTFSYCIYNLRFYIAFGGVSELF